MEASDIFDRFLKATGVKTDVSLAEALEVTPQAVSHARKKKQVPPTWAIAIAEKYQVSLDWLLLGRGEMTCSYAGAEGWQGVVALRSRIESLEREVENLKEKVLAKEEILAAKDEALAVYRIMLETRRHIEKKGDPAAGGMGSVADTFGPACGPRLTPDSEGNARKAHTAHGPPATNWSSEP
jgi:hypothetical protein